MRNCKKEIQQHCSNANTSSIIICLAEFTQELDFDQKCRKIVMKRITQQSFDFRLLFYFNSYDLYVILCNLKRFWFKIYIVYYKQLTFSIIHFSYILWYNYNCKIIFLRLNTDLTRACRLDIKKYCTNVIQKVCSI